MAAILFVHHVISPSGPGAGIPGLMGDVEAYIYLYVFICIDIYICLYGSKGTLCLTDKKVGPGHWNRYIHFQSLHESITWVGASAVQNVPPRSLISLAGNESGI